MANPIIHGGQASPLSFYETTTEQYHPLGTRGYLQDGRVFYFTSNTSSSALTVGELLVRPEIVANHVGLATATACLVAGSNVATDVTLGATAAAANLYRDGFLNVDDDTGEGRCYKIAGHAAIGSAGTGDFQLYDSIPAAGVSGAGTTVSLIKNAYASPQQSNVDQIDIPVGVPQATFAAGDSTPQYGWIQTWGECPVLFDETIATVGQAVTIGSSTAGAVEEDNTATTVSQEFIVGYSIQITVDTEHQMVDLRIRP